MKKILMLHGINHNMFGQRDPAQYGTVTLAEIDASLRSLSGDLHAVADAMTYDVIGSGRRALDHRPPHRVGKNMALRRRFVAQPDLEGSTFRRRTEAEMKTQRLLISWR